MAKRFTASHLLKKEMIVFIDLDIDHWLDYIRESTERELRSLAYRDDYLIDEEVRFVQIPLENGDLEIKCTAYGHKE